MSRIGLHTQVWDKILLNPISWILAWVALFSVVKADDPLLQILQAESEGNSIDRSNELSKWLLLDEKVAQKEGLSSPVALLRWHTGQMKMDNAWVSVKDLAPQKQDAKLLNYEKERSDSFLDIETHRKMARWCQQHGLDLQSRAHWFGVLDQNPRDEESQRSLGYIYRQNRWLSPEEVALVDQKSKADYESIKRWVPKIRDWVIAIEGQDSKKRLKAIQQIKELDDPKIVPSIALAIGSVSPDTASHLLKVVEKFQTAEACFLLVNIAIADPTSELGTAAIEGLSKYPYGFFVPDLLDMMSSEYQSSHQYYPNGNGVMKLQVVQMREMRKNYDIDHFQRRFAGPNHNLVTNNRLTEKVINASRNPLQIRTLGLVENELANAIASNESRRVAQDSEASMERTNREIRDWQARLATVLRSVTKKQFSDEPKPWWEWWDQYEELYVAGEKYMDYSYYEDTSVAYLESRVAYSVRDRVSDYPLLRNVISCLVAGTPIQTQSGLRSVESIRVGDLVVAQNIQSGEIQLRPVLRTTVRPPAKTYNIALVNGEKIQATLGHRWWVIGQGWVKTKDLKEGMSMRTDSGYATIESLKDADAAVTYNLLVDQDHTYFVGQSRVLSFDASEAIPTFYKVPGLAPSPLRSE
ncbi:MAG: polymorphic toxin-type HINT domain-containing protein [Planctomycetota bacterium]|jgi:hypothetical protein